VLILDVHRVGMSGAVDMLVSCTHALIQQVHVLLLPPDEGPRRRRPVRLSSARRVRSPTPDVWNAIGSRRQAGLLAEEARFRFAVVGVLRCMVTARCGMNSLWVRLAAWSGAAMLDARLFEMADTET
jgi:hypothetical protein